MSEVDALPLTRPLTASDFDQVVAIDAKIIGRSRPGFFRKRLAAALAEPGYFIYIACESENKLQGFLLARLLGGEYGEAQSIAVLDALGVAPVSQGKGIGTLLIQEFERILRRKHMREIQTQTDWRRFSFLRFLFANGFLVAPVYVLEREVSNLDTRLRVDPVANHETASGELDYSDTGTRGGETLARDRVPCRSLARGDLETLIRINRKVTGLEMREFFQRKVKEVLDESGIRVSLVAEVDGQPAGFIMARVDYGEFGRTEPAAVLDAIAVDPAYGRQQVGSALLSQLLSNLTSLRLEAIRTVVLSNRFDLLSFLTKNGFKPGQRLTFSKRID
ncbi:MAG: GNAT family N-acetyltransferase [Gammaproteobacteria bacterium]|nr:MAG: GNAT family N-acetyltransferase [Gammaproteobacteria bacterium]